jgi:hypothetical protein
MTFAIAEQVFAISASVKVGCTKNMMDVSRNTRALCHREAKRDPWIAALRWP